MRKQKHLDDLTAQLAHLREENSHMVAGIAVTRQHYVTIEEENSVLRAQFLELDQRLASLNEIVETAGGFWMEKGQGGGGVGYVSGGGGFYDGVNLGFHNQTTYGFCLYCSCWCFQLLLNHAPITVSLWMMWCSVLFRQ